MPKQCTICTHPKREEIDRLLAGSKSSLRAIAGQFRTAKSTLSDHRKNCIPRGLSELQAARATVDAPREDPTEVGIVSRERLSADAFREAIAQNASAQVTALVSVERSVAKAFEVVNLLLDACDRDLRDPDDPTAYSLKPRAGEIEIEWEERQDPTASGTEVWLKRSGTLQQALDVAFCDENRKLVRTRPVAEKNRTKLLLQTVDRMMKAANFLAQLEGRFSDVNKELGQENTMTLDTLVQILVQGGINVHVNASR